MQRPSALFDRALEWADLVRFTRRDRTGLAIVRGRRRHGKSAILRALAEATGAFYYQAVRGVPTDQRRDLAQAYAAHAGGPEPAFESWESVVETLLDGDGTSSRLSIIDELPYLTESAPELESVLQRGLDASTPAGGSVVLCGSSMTIMTSLLVGSAPLRGRAQLELDVRPFDFRTMREFLGLPPTVAFGVHAAIGGVPGYAVDLLDRTLPTDEGDVDRWLVKVVASPRRPLVHEARAMLELEGGVREPAVYLSVLAALASGATRTGQVASRLGQSSDKVAHALSTLQDLGLAGRTEDVLRPTRPTWWITDPLLHLYAAVLRPNWALVEQGEPERLAARAMQPWRSQVLGPHLEHLARVWVAQYADADTLGGVPDRVGRTTVNDRAARTRHEVDLVAMDGTRILAIGEAKLRRMTVDDVVRLRHIRDLLPDADGARLILVSATGFDPGPAARDVELVNLDRLYTGH